MAASPVTISIRMLPRAHQKLHDLAKAKGYSASGYAALLYEAAFAARIGQERGDPVTDAELDEQVRLVFACAGQANTAAIAKATGIPEVRVVRILDGWKKAGRAKK